MRSRDGATQRIDILKLFFSFLHIQQQFHHILITLVSLSLVSLFPDACVNPDTPAKIANRTTFPARRHHVKTGALASSPRNFPTNANVHQVRSLASRRTVAIVVVVVSLTHFSHFPHDRWWL